MITLFFRKMQFQGFYVQTQMRWYTTKNPGLTRICQRPRSVHKGLLHTRMSASLWLVLVPRIFDLRKQGRFCSWARRDDSGWSSDRSWGKSTVHAAIALTWWALWEERNRAGRRGCRTPCAGFQYIMGVSKAPMITGQTSLDMRYDVIKTFISLCWVINDLQPPDSQHPFCFALDLYIILCIHFLAWYIWQLQAVYSFVYDS